MEFGKLSDLSSVHWDLPPDDPSNERWRVPFSEHQLFVGTPAWGSKAFVGKIYPVGANSDTFLSYYAQNFDCIELNTTHYRIPTEDTAKDWLSQVTPDFRFCPKLPKDISHDKVGLLDKPLMQAWTRFLETIQPNLGPCFIQFSEHFSYMEKLFLFRFIEHWPKEFELSIELRHPSWFQKNKILPALGDFLHQKNIGLIITDVAGRRDVLHTSLPTDWSMIRLIGNGLHPSDETRLREWSQRLKTWEIKDVRRTYLFLHQPDDVMSVEFAELAQGFLGRPHVKRVEAQKQLGFI